MSRKNHSSIFTQIAVWTIVACAIAIALSALGAYLITAQILPQNSVGTISKLVAAIALFAAVSLAVRQKGRGDRWITSMGICAFYLVVVLLCKLAFFPGEIKQLPLYFLVCIGAGALATMLFNGRKRSRRMVASKRMR